MPLVRAEANLTTDLTTNSVNTGERMRRTAKSHDLSRPLLVVGFEPYLLGSSGNPINVIVAWHARGQRFAPAILHSVCLSDVGVSGLTTNLTSNFLAGHFLIELVERSYSLAIGFLSASFLFSSFCPHFAQVRSIRKSAGLR